jgi:feruloyl-CoA synthase
MRLQMAALDDDCCSSSAQRVLRLVFLTEKLSIDAGELTDKGVVNQRNILRRHSASVEQLYADAADDRVIRVIPEADGTP